MDIKGRKLRRERRKTSKEPVAASQSGSKQVTRIEGAEWELKVAARYREMTEKSSV